MITRLEVEIGERSYIKGFDCFSFNCSNSSFAFSCEGQIITTLSVSPSFDSKLSQSLLLFRISSNGGSILGGSSIDFKTSVSTFPSKPTSPSFSFSLSFSFFSKCQALGTSNKTGASIDSEWVTISTSSLQLINSNNSNNSMRYLKRGQSTVNVSYSPPSPQGLHPYKVAILRR